jgi:exopolysaccharide biosynthesis polyprenyl glycosylphosphotransferase
MLTRDREQGGRTRVPLVAGRPAAGKAFDRLKYLIAATDVLSVILALVGVALVRRGVLRVPGGQPLSQLLVASVIFVIVFASFGLYSLSRLYPAEEFRRIIAAVSVAVSGMVLFGVSTRNAPQRASVAMVWAFALVASLGTRRVWHAFIAWMRRQGHFTFRTLVVGTNEEARRLAKMMARGAFGYRTVGLVRTTFGPEDTDGFPVWGDLAGIEQAIAESEAECLFVATSAVTSEELAKVTKVAREGRAEVRLSSMISDIMSTRLTVQPVGNVVTLSLKPAQLTGLQPVTKRILDMTLAVAALILSLLPMALIALALKMTSRGPVFYRQERVGLHGKAFGMLKFRTMVAGAESMLDSLRERNEATGPLFKLRNDPRITTVGRFLRRFSLDELPQFWNVLRGDMSVVGPRPPLPEEVALYEDWHHGRLEVRPGITGLWQVRGRSQLPFDDYVRLDLYYIENWSLAFDLYILIKTVPAVLSGKGAF